MKVLQINKFYYLKGGSERYFFDLCRLLEQNRHQVIHFSMRSERNLPSIYHHYFAPKIDYQQSKSTLKKIKDAIYFFSNPQANLKLEKLITDTKPDIAHLHNIYHQLSFSILSVLKKHKIPTIMTLHDYKLICPNYTLYRQGKICEKCQKGKYYYTVINKCIRNSYLASGLCCLEAYFNYITNIYENIDLFIAPSNFLRKKFIQFGFPQHKIVHLPNFTNKSTEITCRPANNDAYILYFGRLSPEKGLLTLLNAMKLLPNIKLKISGQGSQENQLKKFIQENSLDNITFLGFNKGDSLKKLISQSTLIIIPSEWPENFPISILEAFSLGKPVIASNIGGLPELVQNNQTGLLFEPGNYIDLKNKIEQLLNNPLKIQKMGKIAQEAIKNNYSSEIHYKKIIKIYQTVTAQ